MSFGTRISTKMLTTPPSSCKCFVLLSVVAELLADTPSMLHITSQRSLVVCCIVFTMSTMSDSKYTITLIQDLLEILRPHQSYSDKLFTISFMCSSLWTGLQDLNHHWFKGSTGIENFAPCG